MRRGRGEGEFEHNKQLHTLELIIGGSGGGAFQPCFPRAMYIP